MVGSRMIDSALVAFLLAGSALLATGQAAPQTSGLTASLSPEVEINWRDAMLTATAIGLASRHAPSVSTTQASARRRAEDAARALLRDAITKLPWAGGQGQSLSDDVREALVSMARASTAELRPDGSWRVTLSLPLESVRQAASPREVTPATDDRLGISVLVVDARTVAMTPSLGLSFIDSDGKTFRGPVRFVDELPKPVDGAATVKAASAAAGNLTLSAALPALSGGAMAVVVLRKGGK